MTLRLHHLWGCSPAPLAHYLKALGILRLVAEQADRGARGWWADEHFCLVTTLDRDALERFFLETYEPTPFVSPWNRGSGFLAATDKALSPIERSTAPRLAPFRDGIAAARAQIGALNDAAAAVRALKDSTKSRKGMTAAEKAKAETRKDDPEFKRALAAAERHFKDLKQDLFKPAALAWRGRHREWMDAALVLSDEGTPMFPSLLGTGGNDGRLDFTNNAMQRIGELFEVESPAAGPRSSTAALLREALWCTPTNQLSETPVGQFLPGAAGGANSTTAADGSSLVNPWDFLLMMEGTILFRTRATRRYGAALAARASAPFAVHSHAAGFGTSGDDGADRGEQWMPVWTAPASLRDLGAMLGEARMQLGREVAVQPVNVAMAVARLGVARGISEFVRYGYLERNGQSNLAVPLGRIRVRDHRHDRLVDDLAPWVERIRRTIRNDAPPTRLVQAERRLSDAVFEALSHDDTGARWQQVLLAAVEIEEIQRGGAALRAGPIPRLSSAWVAACNDGSATWRLALALGSAATGDRHRGLAVSSVREHWLPLTPDLRRYREREGRLAQDPRVVMSGRDGVADCIALVLRQLLEAERHGVRQLQLVAAPGFGAELWDLADLLAGAVDLNRVMALARALMAVDWRNAQRLPRSAARPDRPVEPWIAIRLAHLADPLERDRAITTDIGIVRRLDAGDAAGAVELALRRIRVAGFHAPLTGATASAERARLWAAALAFPICVRTARNLARQFDPNSFEENR